MHGQLKSQTLKGTNSLTHISIYCNGSLETCAKVTFFHNYLVGLLKDITSPRALITLALYLGFLCF